MVTKTFCDKCGKQIPRIYGRLIMGSGVPWGASNYSRSLELDVCKPCYDTLYRQLKKKRGFA